MTVLSCSKDNPVIPNSDPDENGETEYCIPEVSTDSATQVEYTSFICGGTVISDGNLELSKKGIIWGSQKDLSLDSRTGMIECGSGTEAFSAEITGLEDSCLYYFRAWASNSEGTAYGEEMTVRTLSFSSILLETTAPGQVEFTTAQSGGNIRNEGSSPILSRGVVWDTLENPSLDKNCAYTEDGSGTGEFTSELTSLEAGTTYYVRAWARNEEQISYGTEFNFTTKSYNLPSVSTLEISDISYASALSGGNVSDNGMQDVSLRGIVWGLNPGPELDNCEGKTESGEGLGFFTAKMEKLSAGQTYYVRAYAVNSVGCAYGQEISFQTEIYESSIEMIKVEGGSFMMGDENGLKDQKPVHLVSLDDFHIGKYEVTVEQYLEFLNANDVDENGEYYTIEMIDMEDSHCPIAWKEGVFYFKGSDVISDINAPVNCVSWYGVRVFCDWLKNSTGKNYRLPTEAEWEYAARGGNQSKGYYYSGSNQIEEVAFSDDYSGHSIHPVGQLSPNELGIYDMSGNVAEWCNDQYMVHYYDISPEDNPQGPDDDTIQDTKVYRGGHYDTDYCGVSWRSCTWPYTSKHNLGFRVVY